VSGLERNETELILCPTNHVSLSRSSGWAAAETQPTLLKCKLKILARSK
jgi:hypothetical protein